MNCRVCGSLLPEGALFCGECGSAVNATRVTRAAAADPRVSDTTIIQPLPRPAVAGPAIVSRDIVFEMPGEEPADSEVPGAEVPGAEVPGVPEADVAEMPEVPELPEVPEVLEPGAQPEEPPAEPFVLSFSTGEVARITGGGLLGRRPIAQPGESVAQVVQISDPGRSVSKTHLEFGLEAGELWICDRYSGNGTVVYPPGARPRRCEPGRRYRVARGSRVEIGDQHFDVG